jgi:hypothetical protein
VDLLVVIFYKMQRHVPDTGTMMNFRVAKIRSQDKNTENETICIENRNSL